MVIFILVHIANNISKHALKLYLNSSTSDTPPPLPELSPRTTINMSGTYEKPVQETVIPPSANYFKPQETQGSVARYKDENPENLHH